MAAILKMDEFCSRDPNVLFEIVAGDILQIKLDQSACLNLMDFDEIIGKIREVPTQRLKNIETAGKVIRFLLDLKEKTAQLADQIDEGNAYTRMTLRKELVTRCASRYVICTGMETTVVTIENHLTTATTKLLMFATPLNMLTFAFFGVGESAGRLFAGTVQIDLNKEYSVTNLTQLDTQSVLVGVKKAASYAM